VPRDTDRADEALLLRPDHTLDRPARTRGRPEILEVADRVELDQVDVVHAEPLE
jgi:hypothetical protein